MFGLSAGNDASFKVVGSYNYFYNPYAQPAADPDTQTDLIAAHTNLRTSNTVTALD